MAFRFLALIFKEDQMKKRSSLLLSLALIASLVLPSMAAQQKLAKSVGPQFVPGEVLVQFKAGVSDFAGSLALERANAVAVERVRSAFENGSRGDLVLARFNPAVSFESARRALMNDPSVEFAEPNWIYHHQAVTTDTYYTNGSLWGMYGAATSPANQFGSRAGEAWASGNTGSASVYVGIIDEGIQFTHPDLSGQVWTNPFDPVDGIDNDGNGYIDDVNGWDFDGNNNTVYDGGTRGSLDNHGTHVAGTIGAKSNGSGVVGVSWNVTMISGKFLGRRGGTTANAIKAVDYFTDLKTRHGLNIVATNNSWGGGGYSQALADAIARANTANILFIAAAGNNTYNCDTSTACYPAEYINANVIAVASITNTGAISSFSNYGATTVDIGAPGSGIWSTTAFNTYSSYSGTSMAAPHVTGGAVLYAARNPTATAATIKAAILNSAVPTASLSGRTVTGGRLNVSGF
jgi:subtilisin family serine protease